MNQLKKEKGKRKILYPQARFFPVDWHQISTLFWLDICKESNHDLTRA